MSQGTYLGAKVATGAFLSLAGPQNIEPLLLRDFWTFFSAPRFQFTKALCRLQIIEFLLL